MLVVFCAADSGSPFVRWAPDLMFFSQRSGTGVVTAADQREMVLQSGAAGGANRRAPGIGPKVGVGPAEFSCES